MQAADRIKTQLTLDGDIAQDLRVLAATYNRPNSDIANEALRYCLYNRNFLSSLKDKYKKESAF